MGPLPSWRRAGKMPAFPFWGGTETTVDHKCETKADRRRPPRPM